MASPTAPSQYPGMGAILHSDACSFRVWAPNAARISLAGDFNDWTAGQLWFWREGDGFWSIDVPGVRAGQEYKYVIDNSGSGPDNHGWHQWRTDARAYDVPNSDTNSNSIVIDVEAEKRRTGLDLDPFSTPQRQDLILYQVHVGSFAGLNDGIDTGPTRVATYDQFRTKLAYIKGLGFNAIALLPDAENPGDVSAGYGPADFFATESAYGHPEDLRRLIRAAHDTGLAVIFDVVYNHAAHVDNSLWEYDGNTRANGGIYFEGTADTIWGARPAHWKKEVQNFFLDHARMLLRDYRADGLRFDAAHEIQWECLAHIVSGIRAEPFWNNKYLIAEWAGDRTYQWQDAINTLGFDALWAMNDPYAFRDTTNGYADAGYRTSRLLTMIGQPGYAHGWNFVRYPLGSHDNVGDGDNGAKADHRYFVELAGGRGDWHARAKARLGWALAAASPGTPMLFMGTEINHWGYWTASEDQNPQHRDHRFDWGLTPAWESEQMMRLVGAANAVRWQNPALRGDSVAVTHADYANGVVAFRRWNDDGNVLLAVVNAGEGEWSFSDYGVAVGQPGGRWREIFNSQSPDFGGYPLGNPNRDLYVQGDGRMYINVPKWSVLMFANQ